MARLLLSSLFLLALLTVSTALPHKRHEQSARYCGVNFLAKSDSVLQNVDRKTICNRTTRPTAEWYGMNIGSDNELRHFCCTIGCAPEHFIEYACMAGEYR